MVTLTYALTIISNKLKNVCDLFYRYMLLSRSRYLISKKTLTRLTASDCVTSKETLTRLTASDFVSINVND